MKYTKKGVAIWDPATSTLTLSQVDGSTIQIMLRGAQGNTSGCDRALVQRGYERRGVWRQTRENLWIAEYGRYSA